MLSKQMGPIMYNIYLFHSSLFPFFMYNNQFIIYWSCCLCGGPIKAFRCYFCIISFWLLLFNHLRHLCTLWDISGSIKQIYVFFFLLLSNVTKYLTLIIFNFVNWYELFTCTIVTIIQSKWIFLEFFYSTLKR